MTEPTTNPSAEVPGLGLNDLAMAIQLIETAIQRGAYKPAELATVGQVHGRIAAFLEYQARNVERPAETDVTSDNTEEPEKGETT